MLNVWTLKSCDTCRKALKWLEAEGLEYNNLDIRTAGLERDTIVHIVAEAGWEVALNRRSTTWRSLEPDQREGVDDAKAVSLITEHPTLMKRPVFTDGGAVVVGFGDKQQARLNAMIGG